MHSGAAPRRLGGVVDMAVLRGVVRRLGAVIALDELLELSSREAWQRVTKS